jgi:hypothetical protein
MTVGIACMQPCRVCLCTPALSSQVLSCMAGHLVPMGQRNAGVEMDRDLSVMAKWMLQDVHSALDDREGRGLSDHGVAGGKHGGRLRQSVRGPAGRVGRVALLLRRGGAQHSGRRLACHVYRDSV